MIADGRPTSVVVFGLGGTVAMTPAADGAVTPTLSVADLINPIPGLDDKGINIDAVDFRRIPGASLTFADLDELSAAIQHRFRVDTVGAVITQGTDTIEETAYHLHLHHNGPQPIVVTGAMRHPTMPGADGPANLLAALITAADSAARDRGVLVVLNDEVHLAGRVRKTHSTSTSAFSSPGSGPVATMIEQRPHWLMPPLARQPVPAPQPGAQPNIALYTVVLGDDPNGLDGIETRADGLVVAAMGVGHVPAPLVEPLAKAASRIPVVLASRVTAGPSLTSTYGFPGSERDLIGAGLISAGLLDPFKARILLRALTAAGARADHIRQAFGVAGGVLPHSEWPWPTDHIGGYR